MSLQFRCQDVGVECKSIATADSEDALVAKVAEHARQVHGVELTQTLIDYAVSTVTGSATEQTEEPVRAKSSE